MFEKYEGYFISSFSADIFFSFPYEFQVCRYNQMSPNKVNSQGISDFKL